jgi:hypothetical protein
VLIIERFTVTIQISLIPVALECFDSYDFVYTQAHIGHISAANHKCAELDSPLEFLETARAA